MVGITPLNVSFDFLASSEAPNINSLIPVNAPAITCPAQSILPGISKKFQSASTKSIIKSVIDLILPLISAHFKKLSTKFFIGGIPSYVKEVCLPVYGR